MELWSAGPDKKENKDGLVDTLEKDITAFQPFFVEPDPPKVLTGGDEIALPVVLHNYLPKPQTVTLSLQPQSWFDLTGAATQTLTVAANNSLRKDFSLKVKETVGLNKFQLSAMGSAMQDAIEKSIAVHPNGLEVGQTENILWVDSLKLSLRPHRASGGIPPPRA